MRWRANTWVLCPRGKKVLYDTKDAFHRYKEGDIVWCLMETMTVEVSPMLECVYEGPFLVKWKISELDFVL